MTSPAAEGAGRNFRPRILQVTTSDTGGGAAAVATSLNRAFQKLGLAAWIAVGSKRSTDPTVFEIQNDARRSIWERSMGGLAAILDPLVRRQKRVWHVQRLLRALGNPKRALARARGSEDFDYPGTAHLLELPPSEPDILHLHNLHGDYFDLRALSELSEGIPTVITLHDAWMLSGHCAHSFDCMRWMTGCGACPDLTIPPAVVRDDTAANWQRKLSIYKQSTVNIVTPSQWLMDKVENSMLGPNAMRKRVIPNGVDLTIFKPGDRLVARKRLGLPPDGTIILFAANGIRENPWKDFRTMREAIAILSAEPGMEKLVFLALGEDSAPEKAGAATIRFVPFSTDPTEVADYYRAADLYLHAARADTFPNTIVEALACGTPVVATATGGIPEQVRGLGADDDSVATGILVEPANPVNLAAAVRSIVSNPKLREQLGRNAGLDAQTRFDLKIQVNAYLQLYAEIEGAADDSAIRISQS